MAASKLIGQDRFGDDERCDAVNVPPNLADRKPTRSSKTIAAALRHEMKSHHETAVDIARALGVADIGRTARALWRWRSGRTIPRHKESLELLQKVERHYKLPEGHFAEIIAKASLSYLRRPCTCSPFQFEFTFQMNRHCDSCLSLAQAVSDSNCENLAETFANWKTGRSQPRWRRLFQILSLVERRYGLNDGHFKALLEKPQSARQIAISNTHDSWKSLVRWHLPDDFEQRSDGEQKEIVNWISTNVIANGTRYGRYQSAVTRNGFSVSFPKMEGVDRYRRRDGRMEHANGKSTSRENSSTIPAPPTLANEMRNYVSFKTTSLPPVGYRRFSKWSRATADSMVFNYSLVFGALAASPSSTARGFGLDPSRLTFGLLAFPKIWDWYLRWREQRRGFFSAHESSVLFEAKANLRRPTGWIRQHPELAVRVRPIEGLISEEDIAIARANWDATCDNCIDVLKLFITELRRVERIHRDPCEAILPILNSDSPLSEYKKIALEIQKHKPNENRSPFSFALSLRSYLMIRLGMHLGFRQRNFRELLLCKRGDKPRSTTELEGLRRAELRWSAKAGGWEVFGPAIAFKNSNSSFFRNQPFQLLLPDSEGLYGYIETYVTKCRADLLSSRPDPGTFFVRSARTSRRSNAYDMFSFYKAWKLIIQRYGVYNPYTGRGAIPGLLPHGSHALRDVIATHVLKQTGSYELASFAIQDSVETVFHHYARFLPHEKVARAAVVLNKVWMSDPAVSGAA